ncbi:MAG: phosphoribosyl-ATP pyrophosphohydrolase [Candidatus Thorarchaeota archaeon]|nr:phosphoribosyl-ATP pyrophosphohydrolase [Candidatus Thorarchaeota archaeon]
MPEKLVRDRIPEIIRKTGEEPVVRIASQSEFDSLLRKKVVEEAEELLLSGKTEEIGDIVEALLELIRIRGLTWKEIEKIRETKTFQRGGFTKRFVLFQEDSDT